MIRISLISALLILSSTGLRAQLAERLMPHLGYMYSMVTLEGIDESEGGTASYAFNSMGIGAFYMLAHHNDLLSVGIDPNLNLGLRFSQSGRINWFLQMPVYVMGRFGGGATPYNTQKIGIAAGLGVIPTYLNFVESPGLWEMNELVFNPGAMLQGSVNLGGGTLTGRIQFSLAPAKGEGDLFSPGGGFLPNRPANFSTYGLGLIYDF